MKRNNDGAAGNGPMLNAYPDSIGGTLGDIAAFLGKPELAGVFTSCYILPSIFNTDLDRGFSVIDYNLNEMLAKPEDLAALRAQGIDLKLDFIMNHASVLSPQFQDILEHGEASEYKDFFIDWNKFWDGYGVMTDGGYIQPDKEYIDQMFFRKPGLPILMVPMPDGRYVPYWNTFYQEIQYPRLTPQMIMKVCDIQYTSALALAELLNRQTESGKRAPELLFGMFERCREAVCGLLEAGVGYLGQMDLNIKSPQVWEFYEDTLKTLAGYGAAIVRLDAFAYAPKEPGEKNFLNDPGTWDLLARVRELADRYGVTLLPEIHAGYEEKTYEMIADKGYMTYDFFLPGLVIDALESGCGDTLAGWAEELREKKIRVVNMLGCHDGIPLLDLKGVIPEERIHKLIDIVVGRGGYVKNLHGQKDVYYQVNATYYSALGEDDKKMLLARALQLFMPGKPQIWYLDLFAGRNDLEAVKLAGAGGHKEINRTNLSPAEAEARLKEPVVAQQLSMLKFRASCPAFDADAEFTVKSADGVMEFVWSKDGYEARLAANLVTAAFEMRGTGPDGKEEYLMSQS